MKVSFNWLNKYIELNQSPEEIAEILTTIGLEVEGIEKVESVKGGLEGIIIGQVMDCIKHPDADKLSLTKVDIGTGELLQIVCGAPNVAKGQKVLVATIGTNLYNSEGEAWKIKKGKIRGELSEGMLCAEDELGLGNDHSGIMVLPEDADTGKAAKEYFKLEEDYIFEIGLTPNRSDATSHYGVAADLAAYLQINSDQRVQIKDFLSSDFKVDQTSLPIKVNVENLDACPRYTGVSLSNVKVGESPKWIQKFLKAIDVRPINNVVDITNFILHAYGQALHAFDADKISGSEIRVKFLNEGTPFHSLDEKVRNLSSEDLMICDGNDKPMCIAGVFGGLESGVTDQTKNVFLESAHFNASMVRKTSTKHNLRTDAAKIFEKGSDPNLTEKALKIAVHLLKEYAGATVSSEIIDVYPRPIEPLKISIGLEKVNSLIGTDLSEQQIIEILGALGMQPKSQSSGSVDVFVPTNKADVVRDVDVVEEILRIYGFNKVPVPTMLKTTIHNHDHPNARDLRQSISNLLSGNGFNEMMGLSLVESKWYDSGQDKFVYINNTSNVHLDILRPDTLYSGLESVSRNINHQNNDLALYEFGRFYRKNEEFEESDFLSLFITGVEIEKSWLHGANRRVDFYDLKKWVNKILERLNIVSYQIKEIEGDTSFSYGLGYHKGPMELVSFGKIAKKLADKFDIKQDVFYAEFDCKNLLICARGASTSISALNKYPSTSRDLALVIDEKVKFGEIEKLTKSTEKKLITDIQLFDVYRNEEQIGKSKKSYAVKFVFQDFDKTLSDKDVDQVMNKLIDVFGKNLGAVIRK